MNLNAGLGQRLAATITTYITAIVALLAGFFFGMLQGSPARSERHAAHSGPQISSRQHSALADESDSDASATPFRVSPLEDSSRQARFVNWMHSINFIAIHSNFDNQKCPRELRKPLAYSVSVA